MRVLLKCGPCLCALIIILAAVSDARAQQQDVITLSGKVLNATNGQPAVFASVIVLEARKRSTTNEAGQYSVTIPGPGEYTVIVRSQELQMLNTKVMVSRSMNRNFYLQPLRVRGGGITIVGERDVQKVSRYTMTVKNLKEVPGSFGDSVNALTSLPGVIRTDGLFGPLVIRGANPNNNRYFIDDIPVYNPMHFGGIHSVINNNLMSEIDLYASAFPAQFGEAQSAVININTVDEVKEFGGYADIGLISASALVQSPILRSSDGTLCFASPSYLPGQAGDAQYQNAGYVIASGRIGYLSVFVPLVYEMVTGDRPAFVPEYWDYQVKMKYYFNSRNSMTLFLMGSADYLTFDESDADIVDPESGDDPLMVGLQMKVDWQSHSQGLYYTWRPNERVNNRMMVYAALMEYYTYLNLPSNLAASWLKDINVDSRPYIYGFKDRFRAEPLRDHIWVTAGFDYTLYHFTATGKTILNNTSMGDDEFNIGDEDQFSVIALDEHTVNHTLSGFVQTKFQVAGLTVHPGVHAEYFKRSGQTAVDPRGMISYEFPSETTVSVAGGKYSSFIQTNPYLFNYMPQLAEVGGDYVKPETGYHRVVALEQKIGSYSIRGEGFYNTYRNVAESYYHYGPDGDVRFGMSEGRSKAHGVELMLKRDLREDEEGLFGWVNYTYTRSKYKSGLPNYAGIYGDSRNQIGDLYGDDWINYYHEQRHNMKMVAGYTFRGGRFRGRHTISCKFQLYSSQPYTPIVGSNLDSNYVVATGKARYVPVNGYPNSKYYATDHQLDIRYTYRTDYSWGYVSWYVEVINCYGQWHQVANEQHWDYRYPYGEGNPEIRVPEGLMWIPNFGVEVKF